MDREDDEEEHAHTTRIADAITRRCGAPVVGRHRRRVAAAVEALDSAQLDYVERRIEDSAAGLSFAMLVALVDAAARDLAGGRVDPEAAPTGPLRGGAISEATILARNRFDSGFSEDDVRVELGAKYPPDVVEEVIAVHRHTREAQ